MVLSQIPGSRATRTVALLALLPAALPAQGFFEQFSYEGLRLAGLGVEMGGVVSDRLTAEPTPALRVDYGVLAPRLRVMFGASYFRAEFNPDEIARFEFRFENGDCRSCVGHDDGLVTPRPLHHCSLMHRTRGAARPDDDQLADIESDGQATDRVVLDN